MPVRQNAPSREALTIRAALKSAAELRLQIMRALNAQGMDLDESVRLSELWMLAALAAEALELGGALNALNSAATGNLAPMRSLTRSVETTTGLRLGGSSQGEASGWAGESFDALAAIGAEDDPFGVLSQDLRARRITSASTALHSGDDEARRGEGAYYTPFPLARRLAGEALSGFDDEIPSVIDPACGAGTFLSATFDLLRKRLEAKRLANPDAIVEPVSWTIAALHGVEIDSTTLSAARLALAVRAIRAERSSKGAWQLALFGQAATYGPLIMDRLRLGDSLGAAPSSTMNGTERLRLRLLARDEPGRLPESSSAVTWDVVFPLRFSNEEGTFLPEGGFNLVLTNPPFVPVDRIAPARRKQLLDSLKTAQRRFDLFIGFVERARTLLAAGGRASVLIPRTFLTEANAEKCRRMLLESASIERIEELGPLKFDKARIECVMLTFAARRPSETTAVALARHGVRKPTAILQSVFRRTPRAMFRLELAEPAAEECLRVAARSIPLGRYFCAAWGARGSPVKDFHLDSPDHPMAKPMVKGEDIEPFRVASSRKWLLYDVERLYRPSRREIFEHEKLLVRKVTGSRGIVCAIDRAGLYTDDSLACVVRKADLISVPMNERRRHKISIAPSQIEPSRRYDLDFICALLQTPVVQTYYRVQLGGGLNVFPDLIESLPIPKPDLLNEPEVVELTRLGRTAREGQPFDAIAADLLARKIFRLI